MMGEVVQIISQQAAEDAWEAYRVHTAKAFDNPRLLIDRQHREQERRLYLRWARVFDRMEAQ